MAKRVKRIGGVGDDISEDTVITVGALIAGYFLVVRPIMNGFGVNSADTQTVNSQQSVTPAQNPFSPQFAPFVSCYGDFASTSMVQDKQWYDTEGSNSAATSWDTINTNNAEAINNCFGYIVTEFDKVVSIFSSITDQLSVAFIAAYLQINYQTDLLTLLSNGRWQVADWWKSGVGDTRLATIINNVNKLPVGNCPLDIN